MRWSFKIARIRGIDLRIHVTFLILLAGIASLYGAAGGVRGALTAVTTWLLVFVCVVLHELGHALAAQAYGIKTSDISLLPIGGVARMERMPEKPWQEIVVATAGPLVNLVLAAVIWVLLLATGQLQSGVGAVTNHPGLLMVLLYTNVAMIVFNLIPAFPLDGGRVLRALLATRMDYVRATQLAASIGQGLALVLGIFATFQGMFILVFIAIFIYMGAETESAIVQMRQVTAGLPVSDAMVTRFDTLDAQATLDQAVDALLGTSQHEFPVLDTYNGFAGLLTKHDLLVALRRSGPETLVTDVMIRGLPTVLPQTSFQKAYALIQEASAPALPVVDQTGRLVGLFTTENVGEFLLVRGALSKQGWRKTA